MLNVLLAIFSMLAQGTSDFLYKKAQDRGIVLETYLMIESTPFALVALLFGNLLGDLYVDRTTVSFGLISGVFSFAAIFCFVTSLREGAVGVNTLIFRLNFVWVAVLAILWLGEAWTASVGAGLCFAVLAIGSVTLLAGRQGERRGSSPRSIGLAILAMVFFVVLNLLLKIGIQRGANVGWAIVFAAMSWTFCAATLVVVRRRFSFPRNNWLFLPITGALKSLAFVSMLYAFRRGGSASVVVPVVQLSFLVTMGWAAVILREPLTRPKLLAMGLAVAAIVAFSTQGG
ncbi:MAG: EamA family transporter [Nitrospinota bacterium]